MISAISASSQRTLRYNLYTGGNTRQVGSVTQRTQWIRKGRNAKLIRGSWIVPGKQALNGDLSKWVLAPVYIIFAP
jgi:hypothetical protein